MTLAARTPLALRRLVPVVGLLLLAAAARAEVAPESALRVAFVYNFLVLTGWPKETAPVLRFCVAGPPEGAAPYRVLVGKVVRERPIRVDSVASPDKASGCSALYVPRAESARFGAWIGAVASRPVLTIADDAPEDGAIVNLRLAGRQVVFDVDTQAAAAAGVGLSSQLLKLAARRQ